MATTTATQKDKNIMIAFTIKFDYTKYFNHIFDTALVLDLIVLSINYVAS